MDKALRLRRLILSFFQEFPEHSSLIAYQSPTGLCIVSRGVQRISRENSWPELEQENAKMWVVFRRAANSILSQGLLHKKARNSRPFSKLLFTFSDVMRVWKIFKNDQFSLQEYLNVNT